MIDSEFILLAKHLHERSGESFSFRSMRLRSSGGLAPNLRRAGFSLPVSSRKDNDRDDVGRLKPTLRFNRKSLCPFGGELRQGKRRFTRSLIANCQMRRLKSLLPHAERTDSGFDESGCQQRPLDWIR